MNYIISTTSTPNHHSQRIGATSLHLLNLNTTAKLPPVDNEYFCFCIYGKSIQAAKFVKSRIMNKLICCVLSTDKSEQQCEVLKFMLKSLRLKYHVKTIGIDQLLRNSAIFEHRCFQNINKLCKHAGKCDNQHQFKYLLRTLWFILIKDSPITVPDIP